MRHIVNFGLLFSFGTLGVTGALAFLRPFSIVTTRVHIVFGLTTLILVGLHLASRVGYFQRQLKPSGRANISKPLLLAVAGGWAILLTTALAGWPPAELLVEQGYEARHSAPPIEQAVVPHGPTTQGDTSQIRRPGVSAGDRFEHHVDRQRPMPVSRQMNFLEAEEAPQVIAITGSDVKPVGQKAIQPSVPHATEQLDAAPSQRLDGIEGDDQLAPTEVHAAAHQSRVGAHRDPPAITAEPIRSDQHHVLGQPSPQCRGNCPGFLDPGRRNDDRPIGMGQGNLGNQPRPIDVGTQADEPAAVMP